MYPKLGAALRCSKSFLIFLVNGSAAVCLKLNEAFAVLNECVCGLLITSTAGYANHLALALLHGPFQGSITVHP